VTALHYDKRRLQTSFEQYRVLREANLALLKTLTPKQWKHRGVIAGYDLNHLRQIERIMAGAS
jgi:hypothetical protein